nr:hypothetical protein [Parafrankia discariae]
MPELRRRRLFRAEYEETTLRGHLGLPRPPSPRAEPAVVEAGPTTTEAGPTAR